ncbi:MAG: DUF4173 domain-containing protein [Oscillospiraceae bacterium]|jgi:hypothetical protein|nr:DUF4173 domain-containing protein [Oscillospiraceae bacterium]
MNNQPNPTNRTEVQSSPEAPQAGASAPNPYLSAPPAPTTPPAPIVSPAASYFPVATPAQQNALQDAPSPNPQNAAVQYAVYTANSQYIAAAQKEQTERKERIRSSMKGATAGIMLVLAFIFGVFVKRVVLAEGLVTSVSDTGRLFGAMGLGVPIITGVFFLLFGAFILRRGKKFNFKSLIVVIPMLAVTLSLAFNASLGGRWWVLTGWVGLFALFTTFFADCSKNSPLSAGGFSDAVYTFLGVPFKYMGSFLSIVFKSKKEEGNKLSANALKVIIGVLISLPTIAIMLVAFSCADDAFRYVVNDVIDKLDFNLATIFWDVFFGLIICLFVFPLTGYLRMGGDRVQKQHTAKTWLDGTIGTIIVISITLTYFLFIAVQFKYFFGFFINNDVLLRPENVNKAAEAMSALPDGMLWSEYARRGFFELTALVAATVLLIGIFQTAAKRSESGKIPVALKVSLTALAMCTFIAIVSAILKTVVYTQYCGLTTNRICALAFIAFMILCIFVMIAKIWVSKINLFFSVSAIAMVTITAVSVMNVDAIAARNLASRHIEMGTSIDFSYLEKLSYAAAPSVERLMLESSEEDVRLAAEGLLAKYKFMGDGRAYSENSWGGKYSLYEDKEDGVYKSMNHVSLTSYEWYFWSFDLQRAKDICDKYKLGYDDLNRHYVYKKYVEYAAPFKAEEKRLEEKLNCNVTVTYLTLNEYIGDNLLDDDGNIRYSYFRLIDKKDHDYEW